MSLGFSLRMLMQLLKSLSAPDGCESAMWWWRDLQTDASRRARISRFWSDSSVESVEVENLGSPHMSTYFQYLSVTISQSPGQALVPWHLGGRQLLTRRRIWEDASRMHLLVLAPGWKCFLLVGVGRSIPCTWGRNPDLDLRKDGNYLCRSWNGGGPA